MTTIKTKAGEIVLVELPNEAVIKSFREHLRMGCFKFDVIVDYKVKKTDSILGTLNDITESMAVELIGANYKWYNSWYDFKKGDYTKVSALDSLRSLIESYKLNPDKVVIIKKHPSSSPCFF